MVVMMVPDSRDAFPKLSADLAALTDVDEVQFDFSNVTFATPGWMISVGAALRQFREEHKDVACKAVNFHHLTYPAHAGFFRFFGMKFGKALAAAKSNERFIPITPLLVDEIRDEASEQMEHHGETLQRSSEKLIGVLLQSDSSPDRDRRQARSAARGC